MIKRYGSFIAMGVLFRVTELWIEVKYKIFVFYCLKQKFLFEKFIYVIDNMWSFIEEVTHFRSFGWALYFPNSIIKELKQSICKQVTPKMSPETLIARKMYFLVEITLLKKESRNVNHLITSLILRQVFLCVVIFILFCCNIPIPP